MAEELAVLKRTVNTNLEEWRNVLTMYPLTLFSSTANVFIASCILSKLVDFHTKSAAKL